MPRPASHCDQDRQGAVLVDTTGRPRGSKSTTRPVRVQALSN